MEIWFGFALMLHNIVLNGIFFSISMDSRLNSHLESVWSSFHRLESLFILLNLADFVYFPFCTKRECRWTLCSFFWQEKRFDFIVCCQSLFYNFGIFLFLILAYIFLNRLYTIFNIQSRNIEKQNTKIHFPVFVFTINFRGLIYNSHLRWISLKPIDSVNAGQMTDSRKYLPWWIPHLLCCAKRKKIIYWRLGLENGIMRRNYKKNYSTI